MKKGWGRNFKAAGALQGAHPPGKGMLLFYSNECGLKHLIMADQGHRTSAQVAQIGHNVARLIAEARISRSELTQSGTGQVTVPRIRKHGTMEECSFNEFHTAMRYGVDLDPDDHKNAEDFLASLASALRKRLTA
jgi:hypothetical protein